MLLYCVNVHKVEATAVSVLDQSATLNPVNSSKSTNPQSGNFSAPVTMAEELNSPWFLWSKGRQVPQKVIGPLLNRVLVPESSSWDYLVKRGHTVAFYHVLDWLHSHQTIGSSVHFVLFTPVKSVDRVDFQ